MEYTVRQLANLAGISCRTLRYYDKIGLLKPGRVNCHGHRIYGCEQVDTLQQILFYRRLDFSLSSICNIVHAPSFDRMAALYAHLSALQQQRSHLEDCIHTLQQTIRMEKGEIEMTDAEKFYGLKRQWMQDNRRKYGQELEQNYGVQSLERSENKFLSMRRHRSICPVISDFIA